MLALVVNFVLNGLTHLPTSDTEREFGFAGSEVARDLGFAGYGALLLWGIAVVTMWRMRARTGGATAACPFSAGLLGQHVRGGFHDLRASDRRR